jgi:hypothetical protein
VRGRRASIIANGRDGPRWSCPFPPVLVPGAVTGLLLVDRLADSWAVDGVAAQVSGEGDPGVAVLLDEGRDDVVVVAVPATANLRHISPRAPVDVPRPPARMAARHGCGRSGRRVVCTGRT